MLLVVGTKVKFLHTGDEGVVTKLLPGGMLNVYIKSSDMEIPTYEDDLIIAENFMSKGGKPPESKKKKMEPMVTPPPIPFATQYAILKGEGVQLGFELITSKTVNDLYAVYIINDTNYESVCWAKLSLNNRWPKEWEGKIKAFSFSHIFDMPSDDLNEAPNFEVTCRWVTTEGLGEKLSKTLKIKPKTFFNSIKTAPLLNKQVHLFKLFEKPDKEPSQAPKEDLTAYTKRHSKPSWTYENSTVNFDPANVKERADFDSVLDLHIENLSANWKKMSNAEIMRLQLTRFEEFIATAIRLGIPQLFVIHGMGEGRLRDEIATRLMQNPDIVTFKNEFHPKYGWGATEVIL